MSKPRQLELNDQRGLTLIELMIALVVSTIVIGFLFAIHTRMSVAYRSQVGVSQVLQTLRNGRSFLQRDLRMAGFLVPNGRLSVSATMNAARVLPALTVINDETGDGNDSFRLFHADFDRRSTVVAFDQLTHQLTVADGSVFPAGDPIMVIAGDFACGLAVQTKSGNALAVDPGANPWNESPNNPQCDDVAGQLALGVAATVHGLVVHSFRIDPTRPTSAVLQRSPSGTLVANDWEDLGVGFTNIQVSSRYYEEGDATDRDGDGDPERDWYSGENQETPDSTGTRPANASLTDVSLSLEVHSEGFDTAGALATPAFVVASSRNNNRLGDWGDDCPSNSAMTPCGVDLENLADAARPTRYQGTHIYRWSTTLVDLRNMGVGF